MKIAIISDIHGNIEALDSVIRDIEKEDCKKTNTLRPNNMLLYKQEITKEVKKAIKST